MSIYPNTDPRFRLCPRSSQPTRRTEPWGPSCRCGFPGSTQTALGPQALVSYSIYTLRAVQLLGKTALSLSPVTFLPAEAYDHFPFQPGAKQASFLIFLFVNSFPAALPRRKRRTRICGLGGWRGRVLLDFAGLGRHPVRNGSHHPMSGSRGTRPGQATFGTRQPTGHAPQEPDGGPTLRRKSNLSCGNRLRTALCARPEAKQSHATCRPDPQTSEADRLLRERATRTRTPPATNIIVAGSGMGTKDVPP